MIVDKRGEYDLSKMEWRKICGKRLIEYSQVEMNHLLRFLREGVPKKKIAFSLRLATVAIVYNKINPFAILNHRKYMRKYHRKKEYQLSVEAKIRRKICFIARHLSREERVEFARHMGFSRVYLREMMKENEKLVEEVS